jgi:hypothetical protein
MANIPRLKAVLMHRECLDTPIIQGINGIIPQTPEVCY